MARFQVDEIVQDRNDSTRYGPVKRVLPLEGGAQYYRVLWPHPHGMISVLEEDLVPFNTERGPMSDFQESIFSGRDEFLRLVTSYRLSKERPIKNTLYAFNASRTRFYPYQFKPLVKFLDSEKNRVLICDEVGLGKTIEAGLILIEFKARFSPKRILIVCPSALVQKWKNELKNRFDEEFGIYRSKEFMEFLRDYENMPERTAFSGIVSLETLRSKSVLARLKELQPDFDLVIVDEAHHLRNPGRKQWQAGTTLSRNATAMVMLTATPVQLGRENLFHLLQILDKDEFPDNYGAEERFAINEKVVMAQNCVAKIPPDVSKAAEYLDSAGYFEIIRKNPYYLQSRSALENLSRETGSAKSDEEWIRAQIAAQRSLASLNLISHIYTRTRRREVHEDFTRREAHPIQVEFTKYEEAFYKAVTHYVRAHCAELGYSRGVEKWVLNMPQRQMASSIPAMVEHYMKTIPGVQRFPVVESEPADDLEAEESELRSENGENDFELERTQSFEEAQANLRDVLSQWPENATDSKYEAFVKALRKIRSGEGSMKVLVFSFFKGTLRYLQRRLAEEGIRTVCIHGDVKSEERARLIAEFRDNPEIEVMLSSKVGSEGLDFQFCHILFNYDLPWNPMEVEQRIGRLDRIGQESPFIAIYHFWITGTIEERILKRLYDRIGVFERSIGELELILGDISRDLEQEIFSKDLTPHEETAALERKLLVLKTREEELAKIESDAARFIGTDAFFEQEVEKTRKNRLYITPEQIKGLVEDFLRNHTPMTRFDYNPEKETGRLFPGLDLKEILSQEECLKEFHSLSSERNREITFNGDTAFKYPRIEFVNLLHPLTRAIISHYRRMPSAGSACHYLKLSTNRLPEGICFFFAYIVESRAARDEYLMQVVFLDSYCEDACDEDTAEFLFGELLEKGESVLAPPPTFVRQDMEELCDKADSVIRGRVTRLRKDLETANHVFVERRIQTLSSFYERILNQRRERLKNETAKIKPDERIVRLLNGEIRNREAEMEAEIRKIERKRSVSTGYSPLCCGCLNVRNE